MPEERTSVEILIETIAQFNTSAIEIKGRLEALEKSQDSARDDHEKALEVLNRLDVYMKAEADARKTIADAEVKATAARLQLEAAAVADKKDRWQAWTKAGQELLKLAPVQMLITGVVMWILLQLGVAEAVGIGGGN